MGNKQQMAWSTLKTPLTWLLAAAALLGRASYNDLIPAGTLPSL